MVPWLLYRVPLFGGFCAPTRSPERSWLRHFSNEYTVPGAAMFVRFAGLIEHSDPCIRCGSLGFQCAERRRKALFLGSALLNCAALLLNVLAACGLAESGPALRGAHWVRGRLASAEGIVRMDLFVGLRMSLQSVDCAASTSPGECRSWVASEGFQESREHVWERLIAWDDKHVCGGPEATRNAVQTVTREMILAKEKCEKCKNSLLHWYALIGAILSSVMVMKADLQRSTRFGDLNCSATWGVFNNVLGFSMNLSSLLAFLQDCHRNLPDVIDGSAVRWGVGPGFVCVAVSLSIKLLDALCHLIVPTPKGRRRRPDEGSTFLDYLSRLEEGGEKANHAVVPDGAAEHAAALKALEGREDRAWEEEDPRPDDSQSCGKPERLCCPEASSPHPLEGKEHNSEDEKSVHPEAAVNLPEKPVKVCCAAGDRGGRCLGGSVADDSAGIADGVALFFCTLPSWLPTWLLEA